MNACIKPSFMPTSLLLLVVVQAKLIVRAVLHSQIAWRRGHLSRVTFGTPYGYELPSLGSLNIMLSRFLNEATVGFVDPQELWISTTITWDGAAKSEPCFLVYIGRHLIVHAS
jgi:hypothetical protein